MSFDAKESQKPTKNVANSEWGKLDSHQPFNGRHGKFGLVSAHQEKERSKNKSPPSQENTEKGRIRYPKQRYGT
jgi:hypothetical protein